VEVHLPDGVLPVSFACGLGPEHEARVAVIFGVGSAVRYAAELAPV
jgi:hypothetical protein